jgi:hypothetical protein
LIRCCCLFPWFRRLRTIARALAGENIAKCGPGLLAREGQHVSASLGCDPERKRRGHEVVVDIDHVDARQLITIALKDPLDGESAYL